MRKVSWSRFPLQRLRVLPTTAVAPIRGALLSVLFFAVLCSSATVIGGVASASQVTEPFRAAAFASDEKGRKPCARNSDCSAGRICSQDGRCERKPNRIRPRPERPPINSHCTPLFNHYFATLKTLQTM